MTESTLQACKTGINTWQQAFNRQDAAGCAAQYEQDAVMNARPMGTFKGREEIQAFWQQIIDGGYCDVDYTEVDWQYVDNNSYILSSKWTMNKAYGVVHRELWVLQKDGSAKLKEDDFEIQGDR
ncbi:YybH family protein [Candidatus Sororendozoicomonas aggregata]|uniref:YybH family protein n=1 Tax=Candidatus Sororendozoicomonas aggregata TaxID=3073239 RepID=UPI002ED2D537